MPLDILSSIEGAEASEAVSKLFKVIKQAVPDGAIEVPGDNAGEKVQADALRSDVVVSCSDKVRKIIRNNFPETRRGFLVVPKVIEE